MPKTSRIVSRASFDVPWRTGLRCGCTRRTRPAPVPTTVGVAEGGLLGGITDGEPSGPAAFDEPFVTKAPARRRLPVDDDVPVFQVDLEREAVLPLGRGAVEHGDAAVLVAQEREGVVLEWAVRYAVVHMLLISENSPQNRRNRSSMWMPWSRSMPPPTRADRSATPWGRRHRPPCRTPRAARGPGRSCRCRRSSWLP